MNLISIAFSAVAIIMSVTLHEFAHAYAADRLGDDTPRLMGRLTLNPVAHFDPFGAFLFLLMIFGFPTIAYGKPVQVNPYKFWDSRKGMMIVAFAGPVMNLLIAVFFTLLLHFPIAPLAKILFFTFIQINVFLAIFNLIPIFPLDGEKIVAGLLSYEAAARFDAFQKQYYMFLIIILILNSHAIIYPIANVLFTLLSYIGYPAI
ncbi:MAG: site-2 protease family protein [bacterium]